jgi:hypothetical protein
MTAVLWPGAGVDGAAGFHDLLAKRRTASLATISQAGLASRGVTRFTDDQTGHHVRTGCGHCPTCARDALAFLARILAAATSFTAFGFTARSSFAFGFTARSSFAFGFTARATAATFFTTLARAAVFAVAATSVSAHAARATFSRLRCGRGRCARATSASASACSWWLRYGLCTARARCGLTTAAGFRARGRARATGTCLAHVLATFALRAAFATARFACVVFAGVIFACV